ncbi:MAG: hypothetical protein JRS35_00975 [Deltaproteobacteria bacterium]|nr:hypothetical protein [Deltaproteobacteria bacterium]
MALQVAPRRAAGNRAEEAVPCEIRVVIELRPRLEPHARDERLEQSGHLPRCPECHPPWQHLVLEAPQRDPQRQLEVPAGLDAPAPQQHLRLEQRDAPFVERNGRAQAAIDLAG